MIHEDNFHNLNAESRIYKVRQINFLVVSLCISLPTSTLFAQLSLILWSLEFGI